MMKTVLILTGLVALAMGSDTKPDDAFSFSVPNNAFFSQKELQSDSTGFTKGPPCLNYKPFTVSGVIRSNRASDVMIKFFLGPKYDSKGLPINIEKDFTKFQELDWFVENIGPGENKIQRKSSDFTFFNDASTLKLLDQGKVPDVSDSPRECPYQMFVSMYPKEEKLAQETPWLPILPRHA